MTFILHPLVTTDLPYVAEIEREAFPTFWPPTTFKQEMKNSRVQHLVASKQTPPTEVMEIESAPTDSNRGSLLERLIRRIRNQPFPRRGHNATPKDIPLGVLSIWFLTEEAHIISIAVRKAWRGLGIGELLLMGGIEMAMRRKIRVVTLEVRVSNDRAISLYEKYNFKRMGVHKGYYTDNREDAAIMTTDPINSIRYQQKFKELREDYMKHRGSVEMVWEPIGT